MKIDIDKLAELLGLPTWEKWSEHFDYSDTYHYAYSEAKGAIEQVGGTEEEAEAAGEEAGQNAEAEASAEDYNRYYDNLMHVAEKVFGEHNLSLVPVGSDPDPGWNMNDDLDGVRRRRR